jgi:hypothetical protein
MSTTFYNKLANTAGRLLNKYGTTINLSRITGEVRNPVTGEVTPGTTTVFKPKGIYQKIPQNLIDDTRILASDKMIVLDDTEEPLMSDTIDGWKMVNIIIVEPSTIPIVYIVQIRK